MTDPSDSTHDFLDDNLDSGDDGSRLDTAVGAPRERRWGGQRPPITPARAKAISERREFLAHQDELADYARELPDVARLELVSARDVDLAIGAAGELAPLSLRLLWRIALVQLLGFGGIAVTYAALGAAVGASERCVRRAMKKLVGYGSVVRVCQVFEQHGAASSVRCTAYKLAPGVLCLLGGIATRPTFGQASGTVSAAEEPFQGSSCSSGVSARPPLTRPASAAPSAVSVSPSGTVFYRTAVPDGSSRRAGAGTRQGATRSAPPEAPDGDGVELTIAEVSWLAIIDDERAPDEVRQQARDALHDYRRDRERRALGLGDTIDEHQRYREQVRRSTMVADVDYRRGGDS